MIFVYFTVLMHFLFPQPLMKSQNLLWNPKKTITLSVEKLEEKSKPEK